MLRKPKMIPFRRNISEYIKDSRYKTPILYVNTDGNWLLPAGVVARIPKGTEVKTHENPHFSSYPDLKNDVAPAKTSFKVTVKLVDGGIPEIRHARVHWGQRVRKSARLTDVLFLEGIDIVAEWVTEEPVWY